MDDNDSMEDDEALKRIDLDEARDKIMGQMYDCLKYPECVLYLWEYVLAEGASLVEDGEETYLEYFPPSIGESWDDDEGEDGDEEGEDD